MLSTLFTAYLEMVFRKFNWEGGVTVMANDSITYALRTIVLFTNSACEINELLEGFNAGSKEKGLMRIKRR